MGKKDKAKKGWTKKFNLGHMASQKFAGLVFCVFLLTIAGFLLSAAAFGNLALAVTGLYTAFVGGRAWSDGQSLKFGGGMGPGDREETTRRLQVRTTVEEKEREDDREEID